MSERLTAGTACLVSISGQKPRRGVVTDQQPKGYMVKLDGAGEAEHFSEKKVKPLRPAKSAKVKRQPIAARVAKATLPPALEDRPMILLSCLRCGERPGTERLPWRPDAWPSHCKPCLELAVAEGPPAPVPQPQFTAAAQPRAVAKPEPPAESPAYLAWVRLDECCNPDCCGAGGSDPHHEGAEIVGRGVGQKVADHFTLPLCRPCHRVITGGPGLVGGHLPDPVATHHEGTLILRSREETLAILRRALAERMARAVALLPEVARIELLSAALAKVPEDELRAALLGESADAGR